jgi:N-acetylglucosaminyldiphosphoundecaprenol N-acetyl-beta-D-mannosaminyltransferase
MAERQRSRRAPCAPRPWIPSRGVNRSPDALAFRISGTRIDALDLDQAVEACLQRALSGRGGAVHLCNAHTISLAHRDPHFASLLDRGDLNLMDGMPLVWTARRVGFDHCTERVYGPDLMREVFRSGLAHRLQHYLYGSTSEVIGKLRARLTESFPGAAIVGVESPPFRDLTGAEEEELVERIERSGAHVVWLGIGTPKQNHLADRLGARVSALVVGVGAAFDFHAGTKPQAPRWIQRVGLEWAFRLVTEPRRLWRRYLVGNTVFIFGALRTVEAPSQPDRDPS